MSARLAIAGVRPFAAPRRAATMRAVARALTLAFALGSARAHAEGALDAALGRRAPPTPVTRELATGDLAQAQRLAVATLQDLGFALESVDAARGVVSASRLDAYPLRLTVTLAVAGDAALRAEVTTDFAGEPVADARAAEAFLAAFAEQLTPTEVTF